MPELTLEEKEALKSAVDGVKTVNGTLEQFKTFMAEQKTLAENFRLQIESLTAGLKAAHDRVYSRGPYRGLCGSHERAAALGMAVMALGGRKDAIDWLAKNTQHVKAMGETTPAAGGYVVAPEYSWDILRNVAEYGAFRANAMVMPMGSSKLLIPKRTGGFIVYNPAEGSPLTGSDPSLGQVELDAELWGILAIISYQLEQDAAPVLGEFIAQEMALAFAQKEDDVAFNGDGTPAYFGVTGLINALGAGGKVASTNTDKTIVFPDSTSLPEALPTWAHRAAKWYMHRAWYFRFINAKDSHGDPIARDILIRGVPAPTIQGYPVVWADVMPTPTATSATNVFALFGDIRRSAILGNRSNVQIDRSEHIRFVEMQTAIRAIIREDIAVYDGGTASAAGGYVGLYLKSA